MTVGERIVLHLAQYSKIQDSFDVPLDVSQDGIAAALRISRAHAAIELKKLKEAQEVSERLAHIRRGKTKRKVYFLTPKGETRAINVRKFAEREGIEITPLLDLRRCRGRDLWDPLDPYKRKLLAMACVFRKPFRRGALPEASVSLLPVNADGFVDMSEELKASIPPLVEAEELRRHHSFAADYWLGEGEYPERLHHLLEAGRAKEAEMLVANRAQQLIQSAGENLHVTLQRVRPGSERYRAKVGYVRAEVARRTGHVEVAQGIARQMRSSSIPIERFYGLLVEGLTRVDARDPDGGLELLTEARALLGRDVDIRLECEIANAMMSAGRYDEARRALADVMARCSRGADSEGIDRVYYQLGTISLRSGNGADAVRYLSKSMAMSKSGDRAGLYRALSDAYALLGMKDKAQEYSAKIPAPRRWGSS